MKLHPAYAQAIRATKEWFQIFEIPIWKRESVPLVYYQDSLIGVLGYFICEGWQVVDKQEWGLEVLPREIRG